MNKYLKITLFFFGIILLIGLIGSYQYNKIGNCSGIYLGFRNLDTKNCEIITYCIIKKNPEKYVLDENCWVEHNIFTSDDKYDKLQYICDLSCNNYYKDEIINYSKICNFKHIFDDGTFLYCKDILK